MIKQSYQFILKLFLQFIIFELLFLITHYVMSTEDIFSGVTYFQIFPKLLLSSTLISLLCVILSNFFQVIRNRPPYILLGYLLALLQIYLNYNYFEYFIVFKTPLYGRDIVYMENPTSIWTLAENSIFTFRFVLFFLIPAILLSLTFFLRRLNPHFTQLKKPKSLYLFKISTLVGLAFLSYLLFVSGRESLMKQRVNSKIIAFEKNTLIVMYEAIANYLQFNEEITKPDDITSIRKVFLDREERVFNDDSYPLMQSSSKLFSQNFQSQPNKKNIIILMFESLPSSEIYELTQNKIYEGSSPFFSKIINQSTVFTNAYASGIHTYYGTTDLLLGVSSTESLPWHKKINMIFDYSLPKILLNNNYQEAIWYYGGKNEYFDNQLSFSHGTGFTRRVFYSQFPDEAKKSNWGVSDLETFSRMAKEIKTLPEPFLAFGLGLTKHSPYKLPPDFDEAGFARDYQSLQGTNAQDDKLRNSVKLVYYTDQVFKEFFRILEGDPKFANSIVIITTDQAYFPDIKDSNYYQSVVNGFKIPLIFYEPGKTEGKKLDINASHLDIIPTLVNILNLKLPEEVPYMGKNLFNPIHNFKPDLHSHLSFWNGKMLYFKKNGFFQRDIEDKNIIEAKADWVNQAGGITTSTDITIDTFFDRYQKIYPYLIFNDLVQKPVQPSTATSSPTTTDP